MDEKNMERKIDDFGAKVDKWYSSLPLAVKLFGDIVCLGVILYVVAWVVSYFNLFGLTSPNTWTWHTWVYLIVVIFVISFTYELFSDDMNLWKRYFRKK